MYALRNHDKPKEDTPLRELDFAAHQSLQEAWRDIQRDFSADLEAQLEGQISHYLNKVLRIEADLQLRADPYQRTLDRLDYRAGYRRRSLITTKGVVELQVPKARSMSLHFSVFDRHRRFHRRGLLDHYRVLFLDGVTHSIRTATGKAKKKVVLVAYGITPSGHRELVDFRTAPSESEAAWYGFLNSLYHRGLEGERLQLIVSDGGPGLIKAIEYLYSDVDHQRCWAHKLRNATDKIRKVDHKRVIAGARRIYLAPNRRAATRAFRRWSDRWRPVYPQAVRCLEKDLDALLTVFNYPPSIRELIRTANVIERSFREVRRRTGPIGCFNNVHSCERIIYAITVYLNTQWETHPLPQFARRS